MFLTPDELAELTGKTRLIRLRTGAALLVWPDGRAVRIDREPRRSFAGLWTAVPGAKDGA